MKLSLQTLFTIGAILFLPSWAGAQQFKIAAVDMTKAFDEYYKTKKAQEELKDRTSTYEKEIKDLETEVKKLQEDGKKLVEDSENPVFTEEKRKEKLKAVEIKKDEFQRQVTRLKESIDTRRRELEEQRYRMRTTIVDEILKVVNEKAKREGYTLVIDRAGLTASGVPPFIFVQESLDITADIVKTLNASAPIGSGTTPPSSALTTTPPVANGKDKPKDLKDPKK